MKRLTVFVLLSVMAFACTPIPPDLTFPETGSSGSASVEVNWASGTNVSLVFPSSGGTATVAIKATGNWEASISGAPVDWCTFSPSSGASVDTQLKVTVSANDTYMDRNCSITLVCGENRRTVVVTQKQQDALFLTPAKMEVPAEGGTVEVEVRHNTEFSYAVSKSATEWIVPIETRGMTTDKVSFEVRMNPESEPRQGDISFISGTSGETVHVYQEGMPPCIILTQKEFNVGSEGGTVTVELKSNVDFECKITEGSAWLAEDKTRSTVSTQTRRFTVAANPEETPRTARIVFSNKENGLSETVTVMQAGVVFFSVDPKSVSVKGEGDTFSVAVNSTLGFGVYSLPEWIEVLSTGTRANTAVLSFRAAPNPHLDSRSGTILIRNDAGTQFSVSVRQEGADTQSFDWSRPFYHRSLIFCFTADWCGYCPIMHTSLEYAHEQLPDRFISINVHGNSSSYKFSGYDALDGQFDVTGYPTGYMDGRRIIDNYSETAYWNYVKRNLDEQESNYPCVTTAGVESTLSNGNVSVNVLMYFKEAGDYKVTVYLTESGIIGYQSDHVNGDRNNYRHDDVARISLTAPLGDKISVPAPRTVLERNYKVTVPAPYRPENMRVLVFIQRPFGSAVRLQDGPYGDDYVDNCFYTEVGTYVSPAIVTGEGGGNEGVVDGKPVIW